MLGNLVTAGPKTPPRPGLSLMKFAPPYAPLLATKSNSFLLQRWICPRECSPDPTAVLYWARATAEDSNPTYTRWAETFGCLPRLFLRPSQDGSTFQRSGKPTEKPSSPHHNPSWTSPLPYSSAVKSTLPLLYSVFCLMFYKTSHVLHVAISRTVLCSLIG